MKHSALTLTSTVLLAALAGLGASGAAFADNPTRPQAAAPGMSAAQRAEQRWPLRATVVEVDKAQQQATLKHGPLPALKLPAGETVFAFATPTVLDTLRPGAEFRFNAVRRDGKLLVTEAVTPDASRPRPHKK